MKKFFVAALIVLLCFNGFTARAEDKNALRARVENMTEEQKDARYLEMKRRVEEIKNMDRSEITREEKKALRNELKDLQQEAKAIGKGGVYISFAGIIIIILLLIILL